jgi:hypothetical protein
VQYTRPATASTALATGPENPTRGALALLVARTAADEAHDVAKLLVHLLMSGILLSQSGVHASQVSLTRLELLQQVDQLLALLAINSGA